MQPPALVHRPSAMKPTPMAQLRAVMMKNLTLQARRKKSLVLLIVLPMVLFIGVWLLMNFFQSFPWEGELEARPLGWANSATCGNSETEDACVYSHFYTSAAAGVELGKANATGAQSGFLAGVTQRRYLIEQQPWDVDDGDEPLPNIEAQVPFFTPHATADDASLAFAATWSRARDEYRACGNDDSECMRTLLQIPDAVISVDELDGPRMRLNVQSGSIAEMAHTWYQMRDDTVARGVVAADHMLNALARDNSATPDGRDLVHSKLGVLPRYSETIPFYNILTDFLEMVMIPLIGSFFVVFVVSHVVYELSTKLISVYRIAGMRLWVYWLANFLYGVSIMFAQYLVILIFAQMVDLRLIGLTNGSYMFLLFLLGGCAQTSFALFYAQFFSSEGLASNAMLLLVLSQNVIASVLNLSAFGFARPPGIYLLYPFFAYHRGMFLASAHIMSDSHSPLTSSAMESGSETSDVLASLFGTTLLYGVLAVYVANLKSDRGEFRAPHKPILEAYAAAQRWWTGASDATPTPTPTGPDHDAPSDASVSVQLRDVRKLYGDFAAVDGVSLEFRRGECFGLLGENGAGKTTTINMICGLDTITSGSIRVMGLDVATELDEARKHLGICPQFDILHASLTVTETLLFFARLKGCPRGEEVSHVRGVIAEIGLSEARYRLASDLSGGMQRRLSLAIALTGAPDIVFIDELSSGLDAGTRMAMWDVVRNVMENRCIVLSTHSMGEVDVLCERVAIMQKGRVRLCGDLETLKREHGKHYKIILSCAQEHEQSAHKLLFSLVPKARLLNNYCGQATFQVSAEDIAMGKLFAGLERGKNHHGIRDWSIAASSMEDLYFSTMDEPQGDAGGV